MQVNEDDWGSNNCKFYSDKYDLAKESTKNLKPDEQDYQLKLIKKELHYCQRQKAMYYLEYCSLFFDIIYGFIFSFLGLLFILEIGNNNKTYQNLTGILSFIFGIIGLIITFVYLVFSAYILHNDKPKTPIPKKFPNGAMQKWNGARWVYPYDEEELLNDPTSYLVKFKDLRGKQYNYDSELQKTYNKPDFQSCKGVTTDLSVSKPDCNYLWDSSITPPEDSLNRYLYDRWVGTIIFGFFIFVIFSLVLVTGFFLFIDKDESYSNVNNGNGNTEQ